MDNLCVFCATSSHITVYVNHFELAAIWVNNQAAQF